MMSPELSRKEKKESGLEGEGSSCKRTGIRKKVISGQRNIKKPIWGEKSKDLGIYREKRCDQKEID